MGGKGDRALLVDHSGGTLEGKYRLVKKLGQGGMGAVYLGVHQVIAKKVAVKFLHREFAGNRSVVARFYREAQAAARIGHRNIIDVLDVGVSADGEPFLVMEYLEGESLGSLLTRNGPLDLGAACGILEPVLLALQAAHDKGIVHRDLKPENVFLSARSGEPPAVKLIDFGISKVTRQGGASRLTQTGCLLGTPAYMSPEQARGDGQVDHRTDIYAAGVVLYELLTGRLPFEGTNYNQLLIQVLTQDPLSPTRANPAFPREAEELVLRALSKRAEDRFQSASDMLEALKKLSVFGARHERLTVAASGLKTPSYAMGDLGTETEQGMEGGVAAEMLAQASGSPASTPTAWTVLKREGRPSRMAKVTLMGGASIAVVALAVGVAVRLSAPARRPQALPPTPSQQPAPQVPTARQKSETVSIRVQGPPEGATIWFDGALVLENPFIVRKENVFLPLRVEADGYQPFKLRISAAEDQVLEVDLKPVDTGAEVGPGGVVQPQQPEKGQLSSGETVSETRSRARRKARPSAAQRPQPSPSSPPGGKVGRERTQEPKSTITRVGRGASVAEEFE